MSLPFSGPSSTAQPTHTAGAVNVCVNESVISHSRGYFEIQWVEFRWYILRLKLEQMWYTPTNECCNLSLSIISVWVFWCKTHDEKYYFWSWSMVKSDKFKETNITRVCCDVFFVWAFVPPPCVHAASHKHNTVSWLTGLLCLHAHGRSRHILNYFLSFMNLPPATAALALSEYTGFSSACNFGPSTAIS